METIEQAEHRRNSTLQAIQLIYLFLYFLLPAVDACLLVLTAGIIRQQPQPDAGRRAAGDTVAVFQLFAAQVAKFLPLNLNVCSINSEQERKKRKKKNKAEAGFVAGGGGFKGPQTSRCSRDHPHGESPLARSRSHRFLVFYLSIRFFALELRRVFPLDILPLSQ